MLHTSVAISMESLSQDKENDVGFIVVRANNDDISGTVGRDSQGFL
jgi:hypothetical protein